MSDRATLERSLKVLYERGEYKKAAVIARELENFKESPALDVSAGATAKRSALRGEKNMNELLLGVGERAARFSPAKALYTKMTAGEASPYIGTPGKMEFEKRPPEDNTLLGIASEYAYPTALAAGARYAKGAAQGGGLLRSLTKPVAEVAAGGASAVGGYVGQRLGGDKGEMVGSVGPPLAWGLLQGGLRSALAAKFGINKKEAQRRIDVITEAVGPERADDILSASVLGGEGARATENVIQSGPGGAIPSHVKTVYAQDALFKARNKITESLAPEGASAEGAGSAITAAGRRAVSDKRAIGKELESARGLVPGGAVSRATNIDNAVAKIQSKVRSAKGLGNPEASAKAASELRSSIETPTTKLMKKYQALKEADGGYVTYDTLGVMQKEIGAKLSNKGMVLTPDSNIGELKLLYKAIKDDMVEVAARNGQVDEIARLERAYSKHMVAMETGLERFIGKLSDGLDTVKEPEAIFKTLMQHSRGGFGGSTRLARAKRLMNKDEWAAVQGAVIESLGRTPGAAGEDAWSYARFLTDWNNLNPKAKKVLFSGGKMDGSYYRNMEKLSAMVETTRYLKEASEILANPSGTAGRGITTATEVAKLYQLLGGNIEGWARLNVVTLSFRGAGKLMGNPKFVRWLAGTSKMSDDKIPGYIARLSEIAASSPDTADEVKELRAILAGQFANE